jgi:hypothetical protein
VQQNSFSQKIADKIAELGLTAPAILLLEAHKPLSFVSSQLLLVAQPTLDIFLPQNFTRNLAGLLVDPTQMEQLIANLELKMAQDASSGESG